MNRRYYRPQPSQSARQTHSIKTDTDSLNTSNEVKCGSVNPRNVYRTASGNAISGDAHSLTVGKDGPVVLTDVHLVEKLAHFDRERIPERVVHANGTGALGVFKCTRSMERFTSASFLSQAGKEVPVLARFSTVIGSKGSADTARDPRGFAVKFYTDDGNYDIVGNNIPVFFIRDAIKFPDLIHALKPSASSDIRDDVRFWDFVANSPEATHMIVWIYSDHGTIKSYRHTNGFSVNTYVWVNSSGERVYVRYKWKTMQGEKTICAKEATELAGSCPDVAKIDLRDAIARGDYPRYELMVQLMTREQAEQLRFDPLDATKVWSENEFPLTSVGVMTLNKNPDNFFLQIEQAAFSPSNIVGGVEFSFDKLLQGRVFSYTDTQRHRLGTNFVQLTSNRPHISVMNNQNAGKAMYYATSNEINYSPNSLDNNRPYIEDCDSCTVPHARGPIARQGIDKTDDFTQAGELYRSFSETEQRNFVDNISNSLATATPHSRHRVVQFLTLADKAMGDAVRHELSKLCSD